MKKNMYKLYGGLACLVLSLLVGLFTILPPYRSYLPSENRSAASLPAIGLNGLENGSIQSGWESWFQDQLAGRTFLMNTAYLLKKAAGQKVINDVYLGSNALLLNPDKPEGTIYEDNAKALDDFAQRLGVSSTLMVVPGAASIQTEKLPANAPVTNVNPYLDELSETEYQMLTFADVRPALEEIKDEYIFYKTDHHWTSLGAMAAMKDLLGKWDITLNESDFDFLPVSTSFQGTLADKTGSFIMKDDIDIAVNKNQADYVVTWNDGSKTGSMYRSAALNEKDQYQVFLGANQGLVKINTTNINGRRLLLFKDSYANSALQFLIPYFESITVVDPRYYYDDLSTLTANETYTEMAALFSWNTFATDSSLSMVLASQGDVQ
jgi:hypothetical protein